MPRPHPPTTSESQWTLRYTRVIPTAAAATIATVTRLTRLATPGSARVSTIATAIHAIAYAAWPDGNDEPSDSASAPGGLLRSVAAFVMCTPAQQSTSPPTSAVAAS